MPFSPFEPDAGWTPLRCDWLRDGGDGGSLRITGELDLATAPELEAALQDAMQAARLVVLDVREVSFVDSTGLRVMLVASRRARSVGARVVLFGASRQLESLLELTGTQDDVDVVKPRPGRPTPSGPRSDWPPQR